MRDAPPTRRRVLIRRVPKDKGRSPTFMDALALVAKEHKESVCLECDARFYVFAVPK